MSSRDIQTGGGSRRFAELFASKNVWTLLICLSCSRGVKPALLFRVFAPLHILIDALTPLWPPRVAFRLPSGNRERRRRPAGGGHEIHVLPDVSDSALHVSRRRHPSAFFCSLALASLHPLIVHPRFELQYSQLWIWQSEAVVTVCYVFSCLWCTFLFRCLKIGPVISCLYDARSCDWSAIVFLFFWMWHYKRLTSCFFFSMSLFLLKISDINITRRTLTPRLRWEAARILQTEKSTANDHSAGWNTNVCHGCSS